MKKIAVILFNLGGPDSLAAVEPFLFNLFNDAAIIRVPKLLRLLIARTISKKRAPIAQEIYAKIGGKSPIVEHTQAQAAALEYALNLSSDDPQFKCFVAMRYWHPFSQDIIEHVKRFAPDEIILLPLYPQFSTTTTQSSFLDWDDVCQKSGLNKPTRKICCYPQETGFIHAMAEKIWPLYEEAKKFGVPKLLLSAHGLPEKIVKAGDPYQRQCEKTAAALIKVLAIENVDATLCFQSRVGPMKWIGPATDAEILAAAKAKRPLVVAPIAFVSDHSETLVELDIEYRHLATQNGAPFFGCARAVGDAPQFIAGLVQIVRDARMQTEDCPCLLSKQSCVLG